MTGEYVIDFDGFEEHEPHPWARTELGWNRADPDKREEFNVKDVPLTRLERDVLRRAIAEYLAKSGVIRGQPEAESWLRAVWWILTDLDVTKTFDEIDAPPVANTEAVEELVERGRP